MSVIVVGGGWAGTAAAFFAALAGAKVTLLERTDLLLGTGLVGGIINNNGRFTAAREAEALGADEFFALINKVIRHHNINFPGHAHADLYDVRRIEGVIRKALLEKGVKLKLGARVTGLTKSGARVTGVVTAEDEVFEGEAFIDCTGTAGPMANCIKYGTGCAMCILRCPTFGARVSLTEKAGIPEFTAGKGFPHFEAMSGSCKVDKESLGAEVRDRLDKDGKVIIPLPPEFRRKDPLLKKACQQYALKEFAENLVILDTGHAKLMTPFFPLESLRKLEGFQEARFADPYSGGHGNSVRFMAIAPCESPLRVTGTENLYCAGEKTGLLVGHTEAIITGALAGHNAVRYLAGHGHFTLPVKLAVGDLVAYMHRQMQTQEGLTKKYTFSGSVYFERMKELGLYTTDIEVINRRVRATGLAGVLKRRLLP